MVWGLCIFHSPSLAVVYFLGDFSRALFTADDNYTSNPFCLITFRPTALTSAYAVDYNYDNDDIHDNDNDNNGTKW